MPNPQTAVITGAGTGVGRAVTLALASRNWNLALLGRTQRTLDETIRLAGTTSGKFIPIVCDVADERAVASMAQTVCEQLREPSVLVNSAGTNVPRRAFDVLSNEDYRAIIDANLNGAFYCTQAFLPAMRQAGRGTIVNVASDAGLRANAFSGPAYVASKFGMVGLTQAVNAEERKHGVRACVVCPGEIDTPILEKRPTIPDAATRAKMLQPEDVAACVVLAIELPDRAIAEEIVVRPTAAR